MTRLTLRGALRIGSRALLRASLLVGLLVVTAVMLLLVVSGKLVTVQSGSMSPLIRKGDAVFLKPVSPKQLRTGQIVTYDRAGRSGQLVTHRLIHITGSRLTVQGDALTSPDPPVPESAIVGRVAVIVPRLGVVINGIRTPPGLALVVYLPALYLIGGEIRRALRSSRRPNYRLNNG
ncbi:MAG: signal peptidase type [Candidatus Saccharibacteria bacterium]|nr:signal peptidase type [Candidatus Saccharibacteria bacterium]